MSRAIGVAKCSGALPFVCCCSRLGGLLPAPIQVKAVMAREAKIKRDIERFRIVQLRANIARLKVKGFDASEIADILKVSRQTVEKHSTALLGQIAEDYQIMFDGEDTLLERYPKPQAENDAIRVAWQMRLAGLSYYQIGQHLGVADTTVERWLIKEVNRLETDGMVQMEKARRLELDRLDQLQSICWASALSGSLDAVKICLGVMKRRSELLGLDAPTRINIEKEIREIARANGIDEEEAIIEAQSIIKANRT